jgi:hypothetical protein
VPTGVAAGRRALGTQESGSGDVEIVFANGALSELKRQLAINNASYRLTGASLVGLNAPIVVSNA